MHICLHACASKSRSAAPRGPPEMRLLLLLSPLHAATVVAGLPLPVELPCTTHHGSGHSFCSSCCGHWPTLQAQAAPGTHRAFAASMESSPPYTSPPPGSRTWSGLASRALASSLQPQHASVMQGDGWFMNMVYACLVNLQIPHMLRLNVAKSCSPASNSLLNLGLSPSCLGQQFVKQILLVCSPPAVE